MLAIVVPLPQWTENVRTNFQETTLIMQFSGTILVKPKVFSIASDKAKISFWYLKILGQKTKFLSCESMYRNVTVSSKPALNLNNVTHRHILETQKCSFSSIF